MWRSTPRPRVCEICNFSIWSSPIGICLQVEGGDWVIDRCGLRIPNASITIPQPQALVVACCDAQLHLSACTLDGVHGLPALSTGVDSLDALSASGVAAGGDSRVRITDCWLRRLSLSIHVLDQARLELRRGAVCGATFSIAMDDRALVTLRQTVLSSWASGGSEAAGRP